MNPDEIKNAITIVLRKYFEYDDNGNPNELYDPMFSSTDAIDEIHAIVGKI